MERCRRNSGAKIASPVSDLHTNNSRNFRTRTHKGHCSITGGGLPGNVNRVLPKTVDAEIFKEAWEPPRVFTEIQSLGNIDQNEMYTVFNMGIGMALVIDQQSISNTQKIIDSMGLSSTEIGTIQANGTGSVRLI